MGRVLDTSTLKPTPVIDLRNAKKGAYFIGTLKGYKTRENGYKNDKGEASFDHIYEFNIEDSDMSTVLKQNKEYVEVAVKPGDLVCVFAPARLHTGLKQAQTGEKIKFVALGKGKANSHGGKAYEFSVEVL